MGVGAFLSGPVAAGPLTGRRVVVTRPRRRAASLVAALEAEGAEVILFPTIEVVDPEDPGPLAEAAGRLGEYDWVVFTSAYGVRALKAALPRGATGGGPRVGCVGEATAEAAAGAGWAADIVPERASGAAMAEALIEAGVGAGTRLLHPRAADARPELAELLRGAGAVVDEVEAYRKVGPVEPPDELRRLLVAGQIDLLTFTSPSTARNFMAELGSAAAGRRTVVIGATTAEAALSLGLDVAGVAEESTTAGLVRTAINALHR